MLFILVLVSAVVGAIIGLLLGSLFDRGRREDGNIRNDLPSTIGMFVGTILFIYISIRYLLENQNIEI